MLTNEICIPYCPTQAQPLHATQPPFPSAFLQSHPQPPSAIPIPEITAGVADHLQLWKPPWVQDPRTGASMMAQICLNLFLHLEPVADLL